MFDWRSTSEWRRVWRYYQAGVVNTLFGFGLYALMVRLGVNMYVAQAVAHVLGMAFNYFTYSRYAFADSSASKTRFALSYAGNYLLGLASLAAAAQVISSPYLAGILSITFVSAVNYVILRRLVFKVRPAA
jgi:putative flippase GtrA